MRVSGRPKAGVSHHHSMEAMPSASGVVPAGASIVMPLAGIIRAPRGQLYSTLRLSNLKYVNFFSAYSDVFGIPDNVSVSCDTPFFIDFDKHGGDEA